jgi:hypothetical protein
MVAERDQICDKLTYDKKEEPDSTGPVVQVEEGERDRKGVRILRDETTVSAPLGEYPTREIYECALSGSPLPAARKLMPGDW